MSSKMRLAVLSGVVKKNKVKFSKISLIVVQHVKKNTVEFIRLLNHAGFQSIHVIGKSYSVDSEALQVMKQYAEVTVPEYDDLESLQAIKKVVSVVSKNNTKLICFDLGGYCSKYFYGLKKRPSSLLGIIEETTNGLWMDTSTKFKFPFLSVAQSSLKDYGENYFVAKAIIRNTESILVNDFQQTLVGKKILVFGFGRVGRNLARLLKHEASVVVSDIKNSILLKARVEGFELLRSLREVEKFDVIFGMTGNYVLKNELLSLQRGAILVNGSTRKKEFATDLLGTRVKSKTEYNSYTKYTLENGNYFYLLAHGFPVNFLNTESVPEYILDLLYSEMFMLAQKLATDPHSAGFYPIEKSYPEIEEEIASIWLQHWR